MRRLIRLVLVLLILGGLVVGAVILLDVDLFPGDDDRVNVALPTRTPQPDAPPPDEDDATPPPITVSDDCQPVTAESGEVVDAQAEREQAVASAQGLPGVEPRFRAMALSASARGDATQTILIQFTADSSPQERQQYLASIRARARRQIEELNTVVVALPPTTRLSALPRSPIVESIEREQTAGSTAIDTPTNDLRFGEQWALPVMGVPNAWSQLPETLDPVVVAVIDSGVCLDHPDLIGRLVPGFDFVESDDQPQDLFEHGCGVAGVIAAEINNGEGIAGVAPNAQIMPLRVLDATGFGDYSNIALAITYAVDNGADIINLSLAGPGYSGILEDAVNYALDNGLTVIAAAGNSATDMPFYPAALSGVISVGSVDPDLQRSRFSNFGISVDLQAPGRDILTTDSTGSYRLQSGTSFAAPQVAGIAALAQVLDVPLNVEDDIVFIYGPETIPECE
jgi:subtilisin family serine protease